MELTKKTRNKIKGIKKIPEKNIIGRLNKKYTSPDVEKMLTVNNNEINVKNKTNGTKTINVVYLIKKYFKKIRFSWLKIINSYFLREIVIKAKIKHSNFVENYFRHTRDTKINGLKDYDRMVNLNEVVNLENRTEKSIIRQELRKDNRKIKK